MSRHSLKIVGASGQGINSVGEIVGKSLKRSGYCVFGYREFPSLIKGGHSSYQIDWSTSQIQSTEEKVDILLTFNHHGLERNLSDIKEGGILLHSVVDWQFSPNDIAFLSERSIRIIELPVGNLLKGIGAKPIQANVLLSSFLWAILGCDREVLRTLVAEQFARKKALLESNMHCVDEGYSAHSCIAPDAVLSLPDPDLLAWSNQLLLTGSQAMGLGVIHAGVRLFAGYPMTPSSPLLSYIADMQNETGMVIKQAEDEITAAQIVSGAMHAGTRALTGTSGGGFDLMSETLSLNGLIENPTVFLLAQRPGPATGLPTWTAQGDLLMAVFTAHGEFPRCVLSVSDSQDAFDLLPVAFNLAETYQLSVIVLTDKQIAEALYTQAPYDGTKATLERGKLVTDEAQLAILQSTDRYDPSVPDGVSKRWLPGSKAAVYCAQGDEHSGDGTVDESANNARAQCDKRLRKLEALRTSLPEPELFGSQDPEILLVGWGSTKCVVLDTLDLPQFSSTKIGYLHFTCLWPLKLERFQALFGQVKKVILIEGNATGQLGILLMQECGIRIQERILKYDGRPFFVDELARLLTSALA